MNTPEHICLNENYAGQKDWLYWGRYLSERQWGTVREDYSPHDQARSRTYRWGEDGLAGISDAQQQLCFAIAPWNCNDLILKERLFRLDSIEGNHGEDVKELYYYLDSAPTHSYMKRLLRLLLFCAVINGWASARTVAQNHAESDTVMRVAEPVFIQVTSFVPLQLWGGQVTIGRVLSETDKHIIRHSGREKVIFKDQIISVGPGFYYQKDLHTNLFLTIDYAFVRRHHSGFYRKFAPLVGISRTYLNATTYIVDDNTTTGIPVVSRDKTAGDWRVMAGFMWGIGKRFDGPKPHVLRDIYLTLNVPFYYPNFRSIVLKPSVLLGASFNLNHLRCSFPKTVKFNHR